MARWRLITAHYLQCPDTVWEEMSVDRETGRQKRIAHPVPRHLDPKDPACWTHQPQGGHVTKGGRSFDEGVIIVCWKGKGESRDQEFVGNPTHPTDMEPIDEEAEEISKKLYADWKDPMSVAFTALSPSEKMLMDLQTQMSEALSLGAARTAQVDPALKETLDMLAKLTATNTQLLQSLAQQPRRL